MIRAVVLGPALATIAVSSVVCAIFSVTGHLFPWWIQLAAFTTTAILALLAYTRDAATWLDGFAAGVEDRDGPGDTTAERAA